MLIESFDTLGVIEPTYASRGGPEARAIVKQARRQRTRTAKLILERTPVTRPM
jgi:hypothetical protein